MKTYALRLHPGQDLKLSLQAFAQRHRLEAGILLTVLGSLEQANLRFADRHFSCMLPGPLELVSLTGTLSYHGLHLHGMVADSFGRPYAGHVMPGCIVRTTMEIAIAELPHLSFQRAPDPRTGYLELTVELRQPTPEE